MKKGSKTVLVTGSQGFTGRYVVNMLKEDGFHVHGLVDNRPLENEHRANLTDLESVKTVIKHVDPDYIIHLAGIATITEKDPNAFYQTNLFGTLNLLSAIEKEGKNIEKIILASSAYVYGNGTHSLISEQNCPNPSQHYAMSKLAMEQMATHLYPKLPVVIARPFNYTGVAQSSQMVIPKIVQHFRERKAIIELGNLHVSREFNDVRMVSRAYCDLLDRASSGMIVNICTGKSHSLNEVLRLCSHLYQHTIQVESNPKLVRQNEAKNLSGDPAFLQSILPNLPQYSLQDTLHWMLFE